MGEAIEQHSRRRVAGARSPASRAALMATPPVTRRLPSARGALIPSIHCAASGRHALGCGVPMRRPSRPHRQPLAVDVAQLAAVAVAGALSCHRRDGSAVALIAGAARRHFVGVRADSLMALALGKALLTGECTSCAGVSIGASSSRRSSEVWSARRNARTAPAGGMAEHSARRGWCRRSVAAARYRHKTWACPSARDLSGTASSVAGVVRVARRPSRPAS